MQALSQFKCLASYSIIVICVNYCNFIYILSSGVKMNVLSHKKTLIVYLMTADVIYLITFIKRYVNMY